MTVLFDMILGSSGYGSYLATSEIGTPYIRVQANNAGQFIALQPPVPTPTTAGYIKFDDTGTYLCAADAGLSVYKRSGDSFLRVATAVTGAPNALSIAPSANSIAVAVSATPYIKVYSRAGDVFTQVTSPATLPPSGVLSCAYSPDGGYLAVGFQDPGSGSRFIVYKMPGFTALTVPTIVGSQTAFAWSPSGALLAVLSNNGGAVNLQLLSRTGDVFTLNTNPATQPVGGNFGALAFSPDGTKLAVAVSSTPYQYIYGVSGTTLTQIVSPFDVAVPASSTGVSWSADGKFLAYAHNNSPGLTIYSVAGSAFTKIADTPGRPTSNALSCAFLPVAFSGA